MMDVINYEDVMQFIGSPKEFSHYEQMSFDCHMMAMLAVRIDSETLRDCRQRAIASVEQAKKRRAAEEASKQEAAD
jgi:hypothetical protein